MSTTRPSTHTGWVYDESFLAHNAELQHPEQPARLVAISQALKNAMLCDKLESLAFAPLEDDELVLAHTRKHIQRIDSASNQYLDPDTFVSADSPRIAKLAAGGAVAAARAVWSGQVANAFCALRPPGHHALPDRAMGFCLYNNVALAARAIQADSPGAKVMILDWDVHHGNGTQAIFYEDPTVLYTSLHQFPFYPGTGHERETGRGSGTGYTANIAIQAGAGDEEFIDAVDRLLTDHGVTFQPDILLISCGFDAHRLDPLAELAVSTDAFGVVTQRAISFAREICSNKIVSLLEGGYNTQALAESATVHIGELIDVARSLDAADITARHSEGRTHE